MVEQCTAILTRACEAIVCEFVCIKSMISRNNSK